MIELTVMTALRGCWPALAVVVLHAIFGAAFGHEPIVDPLSHFAGGCAVAYCAFVFMRNLRALFGQPSHLVEGLLAIGLSSLAALGWELAELASDLLFGTTIQLDARNTLRDLALGVGGGTIVAILQQSIRFHALQRRTG